MQFLEQAIEIYIYIYVLFESVRGLASGLVRLHKAVCLLLAGVGWHEPGAKRHTGFQRP